jgi:hypothetical protein
MSRYLRPLWLCALICAAAPQLSLSADAETQPARDTRQTVQALVDDSKARLAITGEVEVSIVAANPLVVSVEPVAGRNGAYRLSVEADFLAALNDTELRAVIAHELGHVWIFTHFPYLQTELLANQIAMRIVSRESLEPVYAKVWQRIGAKGSLAAVLGEK